MDTPTAAHPAAIAEPATDLTPLVAQRLGADAIELIRLRAELDRAAARITRLEQDLAEARQVAAAGQE